MATPVDVLLIVSHPDDDALFAGELQLSWNFLNWAVVCATYERSSPRGRELMEWQTYVGTPSESIFFLGHQDSPWDFRLGRCTLDAGRVREQLLGLGLSPRLVVTHNDIGEYGHPHHVMVHDLVTDLYRGTRLLLFGYGKKDPDITLRCTGKVPAMTRCYKSQARILRRFVSTEESFVWANNARHTT